MPLPVYKAISDAIQACQLNGQDPKQAAASASDQIDAFLSGLQGRADPLMQDRAVKSLDLHRVRTLIAVLTDSGQTFNALTIHLGFRDNVDGGPRSPPDGVVHFAAILQ